MSRTRADPIAPVSSAKTSDPIWGIRLERQEEQESSKDNTSSEEAGSRGMHRDVHPSRGPGLAG